MTAYIHTVYTHTHTHTVLKKDFLVVQGDWNAKVGLDAQHNWAGMVG